MDLNGGDICLSKSCVMHCPQGTYALRSKEDETSPKIMLSALGEFHMLRTVSTQHKMKWQSGVHPVALIILAAHWIHKAAEWIISLEKGILQLPLGACWELLHRRWQWKRREGFFFPLSLLVPKSFLRSKWDFFFFFVPHGMWDLSSSTRNQTHAPWIGSTESWPLTALEVPQGRNFDNDNKRLTINCFFLGLTVRLIVIPSVSMLFCAPQWTSYMPLIAGYHNDLCPCLSTPGQEL